MSDCFRGVRRSSSAGVIKNTVSDVRELLTLKYEIINGHSDVTRSSWFLFIFYFLCLARSDHLSLLRLCGLSILILES